MDLNPKFVLYLEANGVTKVLVFVNLAHHKGKGKLVDLLAEKYDICGRFNGGANAGTSS